MFYSFILLFEIKNQFALKSLNCFPRKLLKTGFVINANTTTAPEFDVFYHIFNTI